MLRVAGVALIATLYLAPLAQAAERLSTSDRLPDRRYVVAGPRAYEVGAPDGSYPAMGFPTRGEMGGLRSPPIKLLDGVWAGIDGERIGLPRPSRAASALSSSRRRAGRVSPSRARTSSRASVEDC